MTAREERAVYTPTTEEIREYVEQGGEPSPWLQPTPEKDAMRAMAFDRWLTRHVAEVKAAAIEEAAGVIEEWAAAAREIRGELWSPVDVAEDLQGLAAAIRRTATPEGADE